MRKHIHKLKRRRIRNGEKIFFCVLDDCKFRIHVDETLGKTALCWRCDKPFSMNEYSRRLDKPHCHACTKKAGMIAIPEPVGKSNDSTPASSLRERLLKSIGESFSRTETDDSGDLL